MGKGQCGIPRCSDEGNNRVIQTVFDRRYILLRCDRHVCKMDQLELEPPKALAGATRGSK